MEEKGLCRMERRKKNYVVWRREIRIEQDGEEKEGLCRIENRKKDCLGRRGAFLF